MKVISSIVRRLRRPSVGSLPLFIEDGSDGLRIVCTLCNRTVWMLFDPPRYRAVLTCEELIRLVDHHLDWDRDWHQG